MPATFFVAARISHPPCLFIFLFPCHQIIVLLNVSFSFSLFVVFMYTEPLRACAVFVFSPPPFVCFHRQSFASWQSLAAFSHGLIRAVMASQFRVSRNLVRFVPCSSRLSPQRTLCSEQEFHPRRLTGRPVRLPTCYTGSLSTTCLTMIQPRSNFRNSIAVKCFIIRYTKSFHLRVRRPQALNCSTNTPVPARSTHGCQTETRFCCNSHARKIKHVVIARPPQHYVPKICASRYHFPPPQLEFRPATHLGCHSHDDCQATGVLQKRADCYSVFSLYSFC